MFIELDGGVIVGRDGKRQLLVVHIPQHFRGSLHQCAAKPVTLEAGLHAQLRGVADTRGDFAGEHRAQEFITTRIAQHERRSWQKLAAAW